MKPQRSLKARALQYLAQREHSRVELRRKLMPHAQAEAAAAVAAAAATEAAAAPQGAAAAAQGGEAPAVESAASEEPVRPNAVARVEAVLDWLTSQDHLSQERFVESRVHARASRFGNLRIRQELKQHALALAPSAAQALNDSELERAHAVRLRKFSEWPAGAAEQARQMRFLMGRGFSTDVIYRVLRDASFAAAATQEAMPNAAPEITPNASPNTSRDPD